MGINQAVAAQLADPAARAVLDPLYARPRARGYKGRGLLPLASRYARYDYSGQGDGVNNSTNSKIRYLPFVSSMSMIVSYYNPSLVPITVSGSVGQTRQLTFNNGATSVVIQPKQWADSDLCPARPLKNVEFFVFTSMSCTAGGLYPFTHVPTEAGEISEKGVNLADKTMGGTLTNSGGGTYGPSYVLYFAPSGTPAVSSTGDSIDGGTGGTSGYSCMARPFKDKVACFVPHRAGETLQAYRNATDVGSVTWSDPLPASNSRYMLAEAGSWFFSEYGINDITANRTADQLDADLLAVAAVHAGLGQKIVWCTAMPKSSSTDSWATTVNQTVNAGQNAQRVLHNAWLRARAPIDPVTLAKVAVGTPGALLAGQPGHPVTAVIDLASAVEAGQDSGKWNAPGFTTDGLHPNEAGHVAASAVTTAAMAADPSLFA